MNFVCIFKAFGLNASGGHLKKLFQCRAATRRGQNPGISPFSLLSNVFEISVFKEFLWHPIPASNQKAF
jgi:hypothetical protein